jgi:lysozyme family protein
MADVDKAWKFVLSNEDTTPPSGKVTPEPNGGIARLGVNSVAHPEALARGFYSMPLPEALTFAEDVFKYEYWARIFGYNINSQLIASKWADLAVNEGCRQGTMLVQRAMNNLGGMLEVDGICGPSTIAQVNQVDAATGCAMIVGVAGAFYQSLAEKYPEKYSQALLREWLQRINKLPEA